MKKHILSVIAALLLAALLLLTAACSGADAQPRKISVGELPDSLTVFLSRFTDWYEGEQYDCEDPEGCVLLMSLIGNGSCVDWSQYPQAQRSDHWQDGTSDPRGWCERTGGCYIVYDKQAVDDVAEKVFNLSRDRIAEQVKYGEANEYFYAEGGSYYITADGVGDPHTVYELTSASYDGRRYYVTYNCFFDTGDSDERELLGKYSAVLELKKDGGREYWSLYSMKQPDAAD